MRCYRTRLSHESSSFFNVVYSHPSPFFSYKSRNLRNQKKKEMKKRRGKEIQTHWLCFYLNSKPNQSLGSILSTVAHPPDVYTKSDFDFRIANAPEISWGSIVTEVTKFTSRVSCLSRKQKTVLEKSEILFRRIYDRESSSGDNQRVGSRSQMFQLSNCHNI